MFFSETSSTGLRAFPAIAVYVRVSAWTSCYITFARLFLAGKTSLDARVKAVPVESEPVIVTRDQYAQLLADFYHYHEALIQYQILLHEQQVARGPDHRDTLRTRSNLASCRGRRGIRRAPPPRSRSCWPTCCGCSARTTRTPCARG